MATKMQPPSAKSWEQIRSSARQRLVGAIVLVILAIAILPWVLESKPREEEVQVNIDVLQNQPVETVYISPPPAMQLPDTTQVIQEQEPSVQAVSEQPSTTTIGESSEPYVSPFQLPGEETTSSAGNNNTSQQSVVPTETVSNSQASQDSNVNGGTNSGYATRPAGRTVLSSKLRPNQAWPAGAAITARNADAARAAALLGEDLSTVNRSAPATTTAVGQAATPAQADSKPYVIQVGAYSDTNKVNEVRARLTMAGYSSFTQDVDTNAGRMTRVRVGPVRGAAAAEDLAKKLSTLLGVQVSVLPV